MCDTVATRNDALLIRATTSRKLMSGSLCFWEKYAPALNSVTVAINEKVTHSVGYFFSAATL